MPRDCIEIGCCPYKEEAVQVGTENYSANARRQCNAYIQAIRNYLGEPPPGAELRIKSCPHDYGVYLDVVCYFDPENERAAQYAFDCEGKSPATWEEGGVRPPELLEPSKRGRG